MTSPIQRWFITTFMAVILIGFVLTGSAPATIYSKVAIVAASGGDYTDPVAAMNDVFTWCPDPAWNNCLLKIMPGTYDIGNNTISAIIDIEGSGESVTTIRGKGAPNPNSGVYAVIHQSPGTEIRSLTVENKDAVNAPVGIAIQPYLTLGGPAKVKDVTVLITNPPQAGGRYPYGIFTNSVQPEFTNVNVKVTAATTGSNGGYAFVIGSVVNTAILNNVTATVTGGGSGSGQCQGIGIDGGTVKIKNSDISVSNCYTYYGINGYQSTVTITDTTIESPQVGVQSSLNSVFKIERSSVHGGSTSIYHPFSVYVADSKLSGGAPWGAGPIKCTGVYDANFDPMTCQ